jgi:hypothetical protein
MIHHETPSTLFDDAVDDQFMADENGFLEKGEIKPTKIQRPFRTLVRGSHCRLEEMPGTAPAEATPAFRHEHPEAQRMIASPPREVIEAGSVLVPTGIMGQDVPDGHKPQLDEPWTEFRFPP